MAPKLKFSDGEKVLCFHGPLIYEAKCLKSTVSKEKHVKYLIHYAGWNKNWDEWVPESRVLKYNDVNCQKQREVQKAHSTQSSKAKKAAAKRKSEAADVKTPVTKLAEQSPAIKEKEKDKDKNKDKDKEREKEEEKEKDKDKESDSRPSTPQLGESICQDPGSDAPRKTRGRLDLSAEIDEVVVKKPEIKIVISAELKAWLVDDWDVVNRQQKLARLPAKLTVFHILDNYMADRRCSKTHTEQKESFLFDFTNGIKEYFNVTLGSQLLYKFERPQYSEILANYPDTPMSKIYGSIHLLRLIVKIGPMLSYATSDEMCLDNIQLRLHDLLDYLLANEVSLFDLKEYYGNPPSEYHRKVQ